MKSTPLAIVGICLSLSLSGYSADSDAKPKHKSKSGYEMDYPVHLPGYEDDEHHKHKDKDKHKDKHGYKGFPNGRPWKALEKELNIIKTQNYHIGKMTRKTHRKLSELEDDMEDVLEAVSALENTLQIQVSATPSSNEDHRANNVVARLFVQVNQNGVGVTGLNADSFAFSKGFSPQAGSATYCGLRCFRDAGNGLYAIDLKGSHEAGNYAGTLTVEDTGNRAVPTGASLVTFEIPEPPPGPTPK